MTQSLLVFSENSTNQALADALRAQNIDVIFYQPYQIKALGWDAENLKLSTYQKIIVTSPSAVEFGFQTIAAQISTQKIYAVGNVTTNQIQALTSKPVHHAPHFSSEGLLALTDFQQVNGENILIFKGAKGRHLIEDSLKNRGASPTPILCYQRCYHFDDLTNAIEIWQNRHVHVCLVSSVEIFAQVLHHFPNAKKAWLNEVLLIATSERIANYLRQSGFTKLIVATNYSIYSILDACKNLGISHDDTR